jgi:hypothetical protein
VRDEDSLDSAWASLRATRWEPPGAAGVSEERRRTYTFALEQAEQMFRAAARVGPATRPLLVFYGLNQAGRAIAAAGSGVHGEEWRLSGHGIKTRGLDGPLAKITVRCEKAGGSGSFVRLSELLDSPVWAESTPTTLSSLWDCIPETRLTPLTDDESRRCPLLVDTQRMHGEPHPLASVPVLYFPPWVVDSPHGRQSLVEYLEAFPGARGFDSFVRDGREPDSQPRFFKELDGWGELQMNWQVAGGQQCDFSEQVAFLVGITRPYKDSIYFFPAPDRSDKSIHPLMAWWAVLHALSMLARYQPAEWAGHIDVDRSPYAVSLENLLETAIVLVPKLVDDTIWQVSL